MLGPVGDAEKHAALAGADVLAAPSLGGESFGMVLTEAFAAGTPVVASDIPGYRDVVSAGRDGLLVPRGDATALAEALRGLALDPAGTQALGAEAARTAERYSWPAVAAEVVDAYEAAVGVPAPEDALDRAAVRIGLRSADLGPRRPARRLPSLEPRPGRAAPRPAASPAARRSSSAPSARRPGPTSPSSASGWIPIGRALGSSSPAWVLVALALMCLSMGFRAVSWHAILTAALPAARPRLADAMQGTAIGVLMSATLPARLGEPSRALIVARRLGRPREYLPAVLGTLVAQTLLNVVALVILGAVMFTTVGLFAGRQQALVWYALAPFARAVRGARGARRCCARGCRRAPCASTAGWPRRAPPRRACGPAWSSSAGPGWAWAPRSCSSAPGRCSGSSCYVLLVALGLEHQADLGAAAAVLFAVNVSAVLPLTPSNLGVFQAACVAVLAGAYGIPAADALGYGIILQAVEIATAVIMGAPALVKEGVSWREVRLRALHSSPVQLSSLPRGTREAEA